MAKISEELINKMKELSKEELVKIIVKYARKDAEMNKELEYNYLNSKSVQELYDELEQTIDFEMGGIDGRIIQKQLAKAMSKCITEINKFAKITKSKYHEASALKYLLVATLDDYDTELGTCWTIFDSKVTSAAKRFFNLVFTLHEDYEIEFKADVGRILRDVKKHCNHFDSIYALPDNYDDLKKMKKASGKD